MARSELILGIGKIVSGLETFRCGLITLYHFHRLGCFYVEKHVIIMLYVIGTMLNHLKFLPRNVTRKPNFELGILEPKLLLPPKTVVTMTSLRKNVAKAMPPIRAAIVEASNTGGQQCP